MLAVHILTVVLLFNTLLLFTQDQLTKIKGNISAEKAEIQPEVYDLAVQTIIQLDHEEKLSLISDNDPRRGSAVVNGIKVVSTYIVLFVRY